MDIVIGLLTVLCTLLAYLLPGLVASARGHRNTLAITVLTVLLGWTVLGWVGALVWACTACERGAA